MNLASEGVDPSSGVFFVNFNQDCTTLSVGTNTGYKLFPLSSVDKLEPVFTSEKTDSAIPEKSPCSVMNFQGSSENICIVERLFASSLLALVSLSSPRKLKVCHFQKGTEICNYSYSNTILAVKLNRKRLVIVLEESLYIHNIKDMKVIHTIKDTPPNPRGLCSLSSSNDNCFLAYPGSSSVGEVQIFDAYNLQAKLMIPAHDNPLAALAFNSSGTTIATASEKGTVIRVFNTLDGQKLYEFRRGMKRCVTIYSLSFSADSRFLCASSNTETVHIFKLEDLSEACSNQPEEPQGWMGYLGKALMQSTSYLPSQVTEMFTQGRAFATVHLPFSGLKNVCAISVIEDIPRVLVASADGYLYIYNLDPVEGGDCTLVKQHKLDGSGDSAGLSDQPAEKGAGAAAASGAGGPLSNASHGSSARRVDRTGHSGNSSYAAVVRGCDAVSSSDSNPLELLRGTNDTVHDDSGTFSPESSPRPVPRLDDENEFPPMSQKAD